MSPTVYIQKKLYDEIAKKGQDPNKFINTAVEEKLKKEGGNGH